MLNILRSENLILKLSQLIKHFIRKTFVEKYGEIMYQKVVAELQFTKKAKPEIQPMYLRNSFVDIIFTEGLSKIQKKL